MSASSGYQLFKLHVVDFLHLSKDAIHVYLGVGCFLGAVILLRRPIRYLSALIPGLLLSVGMEALDLWDDSRSSAYLHWGASLHDILNTNLIPLVLVFFLKRVTVENQMRPGD